MAGEAGGRIHIRVIPSELGFARVSVNRSRSRHSIFKFALDMETNIILDGHISSVTRKQLPLHLWPIVRTVSSQVSLDF